MGPVQVLVVGFEHPRFSGAVLAEFARLGQAGIVQLLDVLLVERREDGSFDTLAPPSELGADAGRRVTAVVGVTDAGSDAAPNTAQPAEGSWWSIADAVPPGSLAAIALIEHSWAAPLLTAIHHSGGTVLEETWLAPEDVAALER
jgi:hypothetical protein